MALRKYTRQYQAVSNLESIPGYECILPQVVLEDPYQAVERADTIRCVREALEHLPPKLKEVIQLRFFQRVEQREVARQLGISQSYVCRLEKKALQFLRGKITVEEVI